MYQPVIAWQTTSEQVTAASSIDNWKPNELTSHGEIFGIALSVFIIFILTITYYFKIRRLSPNVAPNGFVLAIQILIITVRNFVVDLLGKRYEKATPFFLMLLVYITISNIIGILGITPPTASLTVTFSLGLLVFLGMIYIALVHQRFTYIKSFFFKIKIRKVEVPLIPNPLNVISEFSPLLSISVRLWGNIFSGVILTSMVFFLFQNIFNSVPIPILAPLLSSVFCGVFSTFVHLYFDVIVGIIQGIVFFMLAVLYWNIRKGYTDEQKNNKINTI